MIGLPPGIAPPNDAQQPGQMPLNDEANAGGLLTEILKMLLVEQAQARKDASEKYQQQGILANSQQFGGGPPPPQQEPEDPFGGMMGGGY